MEKEASMEDSKPILINSSIHNNGDGDPSRKLSAEEVKGALEITASTGKFWLDWEELKNILYFQLKQVLSEYPEATMGDDQQVSALGERYLQLVKRLEEALFSFIEGPPFTLQRLSEILLNARTIYPKLSKLALALEKNLLVTSTLTKSTEPYPPLIAKSEEHTKEIEPQPVSKPEPEPKPKPELKSEPLHELELELPEPQQREHEPVHALAEPEKRDPHSSSVENGLETTTGLRDEVMTEADADVDASVIEMDPVETFGKTADSPDRVDAEADGSVTVDAMETFEKVINSPGPNPEPPIAS